MIVALVVMLIYVAIPCQILGIFKKELCIAEQTQYLYQKIVVIVKVSPLEMQKKTLVVYVRVMDRLVIFVLAIPLVVIIIQRQDVNQKMFVAFVEV